MDQATFPATVTMSKHHYCSIEEGGCNPVQDNGGPDEGVIKGRVKNHFVIRHMACDNGMKGSELKVECCYGDKNSRTFCMYMYFHAYMLFLPLYVHVQYIVVMETILDECRTN